MVNKIKEIIAYSQNLPIESLAYVNEWVNRWRRAKSWFIDYFGGTSYTYPEPLTFEMDEESKQEAFDIFGNKADYRLQDFLFSIGYKDFFANHLSEPYENIPAGTKVLKAFKYFIDDENEVRHWQDKASMVIQSNKIEGYLTLSVDPVDFLSSSENAENWRSCHALDGDYRVGNVSYMLDNSTCIAYISSKEEKQFQRFPFMWNSKKWRCLFFFSNDRDMVFAGRPYPFSSKPIIDAVKDKIFDPVFHIQYTNWYDKSMSYNGDLAVSQDYYAVGNSIIPANKLIIDPGNPLHYNDLLFSSFYKPYYAYRKSDWLSHPNYICNERTIRVEVGTDNIPCPICGRALMESGSFICDHCERTYGTRDDDEWGYCHNCGDHIPADDLYWDPDETMLLCESCYNELVHECAKCHHVHNRVNTLYEYNNKYYCWGCLPEEERERIFYNG